MSPPESWCPGVPLPSLSPCSPSLHSSPALNQGPLGNEGLTFAERHLAEYLYIALAQTICIASLSDGNCQWEPRLREGPRLTGQANFGAWIPTKVCLLYHLCSLHWKMGLMFHRTTWGGRVFWGRKLLQTCQHSAWYITGAPHMLIPLPLLSFHPCSIPEKLMTCQRAREVLA